MLLKISGSLLKNVDDLHWRTDEEAMI